MADVAGTLYRQILMPTDFSLASAEMLERAVGLAVHQGAALRVFHAELFDGDRQQAAARREETLATIARHREAWSDHPHAAEATFEYASAPAQSATKAIDAEIDRSRPDLVVMATHGGGLLTESVAEHVVETAPCPVLTCRRGATGAWPRGSGRIVVPVDFSQDARAALLTARALAGRNPISVVHVVDDDAPALDSAATAAREAKLREWADEFGEATLLRGRPGPALVDASRDPDVALVVVGTHAVHSRTERMLGTMAVTLTGKSHAPVLTVR